MTDEMQSYFDLLKRCLLRNKGRIPSDRATILAAIASGREPTIFIKDMSLLVAMLADDDQLEFYEALCELVCQHPELVGHAKQITADAVRMMKAAEPS